MKGENVALRALEPSDIDFLFSMENDQKLWHLSNTLTPFSRFVLEQYLINAHEDIYATRQLRLVIELHSDIAGLRPVGLIDLYEFDPNNMRAGVGIVIDAAMRRKSYGKEALALLVAYAFDTLKLKQLYAGIPAYNNASIRLFKGEGFAKTGIRRSWIRFGDGWLDEHFYQKIRTA